jgi:hypothetical protein
MSKSTSRGIFKDYAFAVAVALTACAPPPAPAPEPIGSRSSASNGPDRPAVQPEPTATDQQVARPTSGPEETSGPAGAELAAEGPTSAFANGPNGELVPSGPGSMADGLGINDLPTPGPSVEGPDGTQVPSGPGSMADDLGVNDLPSTVASSTNYGGYGGYGGGGGGDDDESFNVDHDIVVGTTALKPKLF